MENLSAWMRFVVVAVVSLFLVSCFETEQSFTLNPDGSGKVRHVCVYQNVSLNGEDDQSEEGLKEAVAEVLKKSEGVDAWKDVEFKRLADGRIRFEGTAYFKDLGKLEINNQGMLKFRWKDGVLELAMDEDGDAGDEGKATGEKVNLQAERAKYQQAKPMMAAMLGGMKHKAGFKLPGKVAESTNFAKAADGGLELSFTGGRMIEVMDELVADDEWLTKRGFDSQEGPDFDDVMCGMLFGEEGPVRAKVAGGEPLFDYAAEVAVAKAEMAGLMKRLGEVPVAPPAAGQPLEEVRVVGVRLVDELDKKLDLRPFYQEAGLTLAVYARMAGSILDVTDDSRVEAAVASDGSSLLKSERDWDSQLRSARVAKTKDGVLFEVNLKAPGEGVTGIRELSGTLQYRVSGKTKEVDLGIASLTEGAKGAAMGATVTARDGEKRFSVKVKMRPDDLVGAWLVVGGEKRELRRAGYGSSNGVTTFTFEAEEALSDKAGVVMEVHDELRTFDVPFRLENIDLAGKPAK
ncbi:MAG: hypothetical protein Q7R22_009530 [Verrucomicrobiota bacterium JB025]